MITGLVLPSVIQTAEGVPNTAMRFSERSTGAQR
jgi:hypothetical protein